MATRNIQKSLIGMEDFQQGVGQISQTRADAAFDIGKVDVPYAVESIAEMSALDIARFTRARVYSDTTTFISYIYDEANLTGTPSDTGVGTWIIANSNTFVTTPQNFGAVGDGVVDDTVAVQAAMDAGSHVDISNGTFLVTSAINLNDGQLVTGNGTIKFGGFDCFVITGTVIEELDLSVAVTDYTNTVTLDDATNVSIGEVVRFISTINCLSTDAGDRQLGEATGSQISYFTEYVEIVDKAANVLTFSDRTVFKDYPLIPGSTTPAGRQISVIQRLALKTVEIRDINFVKTADTGISIRPIYNIGTKISNVSINNVLFNGAAIYFDKSYNCTAYDCTVDLDPEAPMTPSNFFQYNSLMCVSSQAIVYDRNKVRNGSQCIDVTYLDAPCVRCRLSNNELISARFNMLTTHSGSIDTTIIGNVGIRCSRGPSIRSRGDRLINNVILGTPENTVSPGTLNNTYGIAVTEGYYENTVIRGNYIEGFYRGIISQNSEVVFTHTKLTITNNEIVHCRLGINIQRSSGGTNYITDELSYLTIASNVFREIIQLNYIYIESEYMHGVGIHDNQFLTDMDSANDAVILIADNCQRMKITGNTFPVVGRAVELSPITNVGLLGVNTLENLLGFSDNNIRVDASRSLTWLFDGGFIGVNGITPKLITRDFASITSAVTSWDVTSYNILDFSNSSGGDVVIDTLIGGYTGQVLYVGSGSQAAGSVVRFADTGNIDFPTGLASPLVIRSVSTYQLIKRNSGNWEFVVSPIAV